MSKLLKFISVIAMSLLANGVNAEQKPNLSIVSLDMPGYANADGTGIYWQIINAVFENNYQLTLKTVSPTEYVKLLKQPGDIGFIGTQFKKNSQLNHSSTHLDTRYSVHLLHRQLSLELNTVDTLRLSARDDGYLHNAIANQELWFNVSSIEDVSKLIEKERVDAAVTYSYNLHLADPTGALEDIEVLPEQQVRLAFAKGLLGHRLLAEFDKSFTQLVQNGTIASIFANSVEYEHANFENNPNKQHIQWQILAKKFDSKTKRNTALSSEVHFSQQLENHLVDVDLNIKVNNMRKVNELLKSTEDTCVQNIMKTPARESFAYFSNPSYVFLPPRLVLRNQTVKQHELARFMDNESIDLAQLLTQFPELRISLIKRSNTHKLLEKKLPEDIYQRLYILENNSVNDTFNLLLSDRVDAALTWPSLIAFLIDDTVIAKGLTSIEISGIDTSPTNSYIACSKSALGQEVIEQINEMMLNEQVRDQLFEAEYAKMDNRSAQAFKKLIKNYYQ